MSDYNRIYNLTVKDSLPSGDSGKIIKGAELDAELNAVASAIASKSDINNPTFTGTPAAPTASAGTNTTQLATTAFVQAALQALYPVGSVYINASSTANPSTLLGFGTWATVGDGKVLVNQDTTDTSFDTMGETGGSKNAAVVSHTHTLTAATAAAGGAHTHTITDPGHKHTQTGQTLTNTAGSYAFGSGSFAVPTSDTATATTGITINTSTTHTHTLSGSTDSAGSSGTNGNLQPYVVVRMWKRTA